MGGGLLLIKGSPSAWNAQSSTSKADHIEHDNFDQGFDEMMTNLLDGNLTLFVRVNHGVHFNLLCQSIFLAFPTSERTKRGTTTTSTQITG